MKKNIHKTSSKKMKTTMKLMSVTLIFFTASCSKTPKCSDESVKRKVLIEFNKEIKPAVLNSRIEEKINFEDLRAYAIDKGLYYNDVLNSKKEEIKNEINDEVDLSLIPSKLINIRTEKIEADIDKCSCAGEIENPNLKPIEIRYSAQRAEDSKEGTFITINYNIKKTDK